MDNHTYNELLKSIEHWNENRLQIFWMSQPDKNLKFIGGMRFYFQDSGQKVATKCVKVNSTDTTKDVIDILIEKFRPDMRMLSVPEYGLYEIHANGDERKLDLSERPLLVQLEWNRDDREGRFLLRRMDEKTRDLDVLNEEPSLKRKLSKKEKKKQDKIKKQQQKEEEKAEAAANKNKTGIAQRLYNELPETSFTRSISNPEAVMKRRRAQKLEKRLQEFSQEGGQEAGGTLRIFGEAINKDVSYKTLLLSTRDTASYVVKQILEKYGKENEDPSNYCLVQLVVPPSATSSAGGDNNSVHDLTTSSGLTESSILEEQDCPLLINQNHDRSKGILTFHIRHKPADYNKRRKRKPSKAQVQPNPLHPLVVQQLNQRLQINNNIECADHFSNQNSPQASSQTSGSMNDPTNPQPPSFDKSHPVPHMFSNNSGGNIMPQYHQNPQHNNSIAFLPPRTLHTNTMNGTLPRQNYSQPNMIINQNQNNPKQFPQGHLIQNGNGQFVPINHPQQQQYVQPTTNNGQILPALIQVTENVEDIFLNAVITKIQPFDISFKLAPTYVLYMVSRYRASTLFHPELEAPSRAELFVPFTKKIATMIRGAIEVHRTEEAYLAFWLANSSDLSHFYKQDRHLSHFTIDAQEILYDSIKASFRYLINCKNLQLDCVLETLFEDEQFRDPMTARPVSSSNGKASSIAPILNALEDTMVTLRKNRVNVSLTIQILSHLFHHINKWLFDRLLGVFDHHRDYSAYCTRIWGERLSRSLSMIVDWAQKLGLEHAAHFHLSRVTRVTQFLSRTYPKNVQHHDLKEACDACEINPVQMRALLQRYHPEQPAVQALINNFIFSMDHSYVSEEYPLEEDFELQMSFLLPEDRYSSESIRYIPNGLLDFVSYLSKIRVGNQELCIFTVQPTSSGFWTVYFKNNQPDTPEIIDIQLRKKNNSMGLSIIAAKGVGQDRLGIYIKNVVKHGAAALDGRLQAGDQLVQVDGKSLLDMSQEMAADLMQRTGPVATLRVAKQAAIYHDISDIISSPPTQTIVPPPQSNIPPNYIVQGHHPGVEPMQIPMPDRKHFQPPQPHPQMQPIERHHHHQQPQQLPEPVLAPPPQLQVARERVVQFAPDTRHQMQNQAMQPMRQPLQDPRILSQQQSDDLHQQMVHQQNLQMHFQPPPPPPMSIVHDNQPPSSNNLTTSHHTVSPMKSPKKVSWVDNQPHQSLHTLIPPSPAMAPSPSSQEATPPPPEIPDPPEHLADHHYPYAADTDEPIVSQRPIKGYLSDHFSNNNDNNIIDNELLNGMVNHVSLHTNENGTLDEVEEEDEDEDDSRSDEESSLVQGITSNNINKLPNNESNNQKVNSKPDAAAPGTQTKPAAGQLDVTSESLTLEDIDEVLSSKAHNNWLEDSAGVIGTQEVYNDPRQRMMKEKEKEKERPNANNLNIEKLSFKDKLKMFDAANQ